MFWLTPRSRPEKAMNTGPLGRISNDELLRALDKLVATSRKVDADLLAHLAEVDARRLTYQRLYASCQRPAPCPPDRIQHTSANQSSSRRLIGLRALKLPRCPHAALRTPLQNHSGADVTRSSSPLARSCFGISFRAAMSPRFSSARLPCSSPRRDGGSSRRPHDRGAQPETAPALHLDTFRRQ